MSPKFRGPIAAPGASGDMGAAAAGGALNPAAPAPAAGAAATGVPGRLPSIPGGLASSIGDTPAIGEVR